MAGNLVPRGDNLSSVGTAIKRYITGFFYKLDVKSGANSPVKTLQRGTAYVIGDVVTTDALHAKYFLKCTTAGTTGSSEPSFTGATSDSTISDGTVVWTVKTVASAEDISASVANTYAPKASPVLTGNPTAPTQTTTDNSTKIATTAYVKNNLESCAPINNAALTGNPTAPTQSASDDSTKLATTAFVHDNTDDKAPLASPALTGNPTAPTQATNNNSTRLATTAFVTNDLKANTMLLADTFATAIQSGDDLDTYKTAGTYVTGNASATNSLANCPVTDVAIKLLVIPIGYTTIAYGGTQIVITSLQRIYVRSFTGGTESGSWGAWKRVAYREDVLTLSGGTLTGTITSETSGSATALLFKQTSLESGVTPSTTRSLYGVRFVDKNNVTIGGILREFSAYGADVLYLSKGWGTNTDRLDFQRSGNNVYFKPNTDNAFDLGNSSFRWKQLYAGTATINTSDERLKDNITAIPDEVLDAWGEVNWYQYQFKDAVAEKGESKARIHTGAIAQRIESVFTAHGLDANRYGLLCYDEWSATPAERDEDGKIIEEAKPAGNRYSLRYEEALCMEAAYQRRRADRLEERLARLEALLTQE